MLEMRYIAQPVAARFIRAEALITVLFGDRGTGKTTAGFMRVLYRAHNTGQQHWAVVGSTRERMTHTVVVCVNQWWPETTWTGREGRLGHCAMTMNKKPLVYLTFFGLDDDADAERFMYEQPTYDGVWFDDAQNIAHFMTDHIGIADYLVSRSASKSVQVTSGDVAKTHWLRKPELYARDSDLVALLNIPDSENMAEKAAPGYLEASRAIKGEARKNGQ